MRHLLVFESDESSARGVVRAAGVTDVVVVAVGKGERAASQAVIDLVAGAPPGSCAHCGVNRRYIKSLGAVDWGFQSKEFRKDDQQLGSWLVPLAELAKQEPKPRQAFEAAEAANPRLFVFPKALDHAEELAPLRWKFVASAAEFLGKIAAQHSVGPAKDWQANHGVYQAIGGEVAFNYRFQHAAGKLHKSKWDWHLKEGDRTIRENCARIYFDVVDIDDCPAVLVFYVGPHPPDGCYEVFKTVEQVARVAKPPAV
jgi:hypothetical protein